MRPDLTDLDRRLSRAIEQGRGIRLSEADLDLLAASGGLQRLSEAAEFERNPCDFPRLSHRRHCDECSPSSWCYFIQAGADGPIKIGHSLNPGVRLTELQTGHSQTLRLLAKVEGHRSNEDILHTFYEREHVRGEWHRPSPRLLAFIEHLRDAANG